MAQSFFKITLFDLLDDQAQPLVLTHNPAGIQDHEITYKRHEVYGTVFRNFGDNLRFTLEGAALIRTAFETHGIDAEVSIDIDTIVNSNKTYSNVYTGIIDFSTYSEDDSFVEVGIIDNSTMAKFLGRENIEVNINDTEDLDGDTITAADKFEVELPPINPSYLAVFDINNPLTFNAAYQQAGGEYFQTGITTFNNISSPINPSPTTLNPSIYINDNDDERGISVLLDLETSLSGLIYYFAGFAISYFSYKFKIDVYTDNDVLVSSDTLDEYAADDTGATSDTPLSYSSQQYNITTDVTVPANGYVKIYGEVIYATEFPPYDVAISTVINNYEITESTAVGNTTISEMYQPLEIGGSILAHMGITDKDFICLDFDIGDFQYLMMATGKGLRNYPNTPFNISFRNFFEIYNSILGHLMYYDGNQFVLGNYDLLYNTSDSAITITQYSNIITSIANDRYFNSIEIGYKVYDYDYFSGNVEFNTTFNFATVNKNTSNKESKISNARADSLGIELTKRMQYEDTGGEDTDGDNDIFIVSAKPGVSTTFKAKTGEDYTIIGLRGADSFYNYDISPKNNLTRQGFLLNTTLSYNPKVAKYVSSKNDIPLVIDGLEELSNDYVSANSGSVKPIYIDFDTILTDELLTFLNDSPNEMITLNNIGTGFLEEATINLYNRTANIKMVKYS